jgi:hypothetical protein
VYDHRQIRQLINAMTQKSPLDSLHIAAPCAVKWDDMKGDDKVRMCSLCSKNVYNISNMPKKEAEALLTEREGTVCVGIFRRRDGTIITDDCPVGLRKLRNGVRSVARAVATVLGFILSASCMGADRINRSGSFNNHIMEFGEGIEHPGKDDWLKKPQPRVPVTLEVKEHPSTMAEACRQSESIVIADYLGYQPNEKGSFNDPPHPSFEVVQVLKGPQPTSKLIVQSEFPDPPSTLQGPTQVSPEYPVPKQGARFILFIVHKVRSDGVRETYNGSFGRLPANEANISAVKSELARL